MFEELIRHEIATKPEHKGILRVVLGEFQLKNSLGKASDSDGYKIVETASRFI